MNKEELKRTQPVVYRVLSNALTQDRLAHAYLFSGPKGAPKSQTALLFAQSMVCEHPDEDGFACQSCESCHRFEKEESLNFFWIHSIGTNVTKYDAFDADKRVKKQTQERIKKKDILSLQQFFESTSAETSMQRVYILEDYDEATPDASNSLLKFLEEPAPGICGILIADEKSNVLPTIQSRCQNLTFRPVSNYALFCEKTDETTARMLADSGYTSAQVDALLEDEAFLTIKEAAYNYVAHWESMDAILDMQLHIFPSKGGLVTKENVRLWLQWVLFLVKNEVVELPLQKQVQIQTCIVESMDRLRSPVEIHLFLDRIYNQIRKVVLE